MEVVNYCSIAMVSVLTLIGCLVYLSENDIFSIETIRKFQRLIYVLTAETIIDCVFVLLEGHEVPSILLYLIKSIELTLSPVLTFLVFDIFYDKKQNRNEKTMKRIRKIINLIVITVVVLLVISFCGWGVFSINEKNLYNRGPLIYVYVALILIAIFVLTIGIVMFSNKNQSIMKATLIFYVLILIVGISARGFFPNSNYDFLCLSIAVPFLLIYYSSVTLRIDPLTRLLNRQVYTRLIEKVNYNTIIIIIDINNFKDINDNYGHICGDQTLKQVSHIIYKTYGQYAYCFRIGGDEFCAILKPHIFDKMVEETPHRDVYSMAESLMGKLDDSILTQYEISEDFLLKDGVSQGYGIFYAQTNDVSSDYDMPFRKVIELADNRMYQNKELFKRSHSDRNGVQDNHTKIGIFYRPSTPIFAEEDNT